LVRKDDRPTSGGRPSLLSAEQQAEADRHRILSSLDNKPGAKPAAKPAAATSAAAGAPAKGRNGLVVWGALGVGALAVVGGALAWMASTPAEEATAIAAAPVPAPAAVANAAPVAAAAPAESEVSTAAILEDTAAVSPPAEGKLPALKDMLEQPSKPASGHDELKQALERPSAKAPAVAVAHAERKPEHKSEKAERAEKVKLAQKAAAKDKAVAKAKADAKQPDNDVTLLAALMAHLQTRPPVKKTSSPADQLKTCKQYNAAGEEQCRARLCAADAKKEPECKAAPIAKASSDS
jgi:hypothetical protein